MKAFYLSFILAALLSLSMTDVAWAEIVSPVKTEQSKCKYENYSHIRNEDDIELSTLINYNEGTLTLTVYNVIANCVASVTSECKMLAPNELHFVIIEKVGDVVASCVCIYDVECKYEGIAPGYYDIYVETEGGNVLAQTSATIESGCELLFSNPSGVDQVQLGSKGMLKFSASNILSISAEGSSTLEAFDAEGHIILKMVVDGYTEIDFSSLPKGIYLLHVYNGEHMDSLTIRR